MRVWLLCLIVPLAALAEQSNIVHAPHGLGQFYEEPTAFRPSLRGVDKIIAKFTGFEHIHFCVPEQEFVLLTTGALEKHTPHPKLGRKGPEDFPQVLFALERASGSTVALTATIYLWLPGAVLADKKAKKILSFQYKHQEQLSVKNCKAKVQVLIDKVVQAWMAEHHTYNVTTEKR